MINSAKQLPLDKCLHVYFIVEKHIPETFEGTLYELARILFKEMNQYEFLECVCVMTDTEPENITREDSSACFTEFMNGLMLNKIFSLRNRFKRLGFI